MYVPSSCLCQSLRTDDVLVSEAYMIGDIELLDLRAAMNVSPRLSPHVELAAHRLLVVARKSGRDGRHALLHLFPHHLHHVQLLQFIPWPVEDERSSKCDRVLRPVQRALQGVLVERDDVLVRTLGGL